MKRERYEKGFLCGCESGQQLRFEFDFSVTLNKEGLKYEDPK